MTSDTERGLTLARGCADGNLAESDQTLLRSTGGVTTRLLEGFRSWLRHSHAEQGEPFTLKLQTNDRRHSAS